MNPCQRYFKLTINTLLFLAAVSLLTLFLLNILNPKIPALQCKGKKLLEPSISHKFRGDTINLTKLLIAALVVPLVQIVITEGLNNQYNNNQYTYSQPETNRWKRTIINAGRWYRDYFFGILFMLFLNDIAKTSANSPRPHWIDSCKPNFTSEACYMGWVEEYNCTNTEITSWRLADARKSFPSGHSALAFFTAVFMSVYQHLRMSKRVLGSVVLMWLHTLWIGWAIFCSITRVADNRHHPIDVVFGGIIGALSAVFTTTVICGCFGRSLKATAYQNNVVSGMNGSDTIKLPYATIGGVTLKTHDVKRVPCKRLHSIESTMTQITEIAKDSELDSV